MQCKLSASPPGINCGKRTRKYSKCTDKTRGPLVANQTERLTPHAIRKVGWLALQRTLAQQLQTVCTRWPGNKKRE
eukprot:8309581-Lingulodinium_polyedra.AAC.1